MNKIINTVVDCYRTCIERDIHPAIAILFCIFCVLIGLAIGLAIDYLVAIVLMFLYNTLARNFDWPTFSIWFWFVGVLILAQVKKIFVPTKEAE